MCTSWKVWRASEGMRGIAFIKANVCTDTEPTLTVIKWSGDLSPGWSMDHDVTTETNTRTQIQSKVTTKIHNTVMLAIFNLFFGTDYLKSFVFHLDWNFVDVKTMYNIFNFIPPCSSWVTLHSPISSSSTCSNTLYPNKTICSVNILSSSFSYSIYKYISVLHDHPGAHRNI